jgi:hypothetical protein
MKSMIAMTKWHSKKEDSFHQQIGLKFKEEINEYYIWSITLMVVKLRHFGK